MKHGTPSGVSSATPGEDLARRYLTHLALWCALYEETLFRVNRHRHRRVDRLRALAAVAHRRPNWEREVKRYERHIELVPTSAHKFSLRIATDIYPDTFVGVTFHLREERGIWASYPGDWTTPRSPVPLDLPVHDGAARALAGSAIAEAIRDLAGFVVVIPGPSDGR